MVRPITDTTSLPQHRPQKQDPYLLHCHLDAAAQALREAATELRLAARQLALGSPAELDGANIYLRSANHLAAEAITVGDDAAHWQRASDAQDAQRRAR